MLGHHRHHQWWPAYSGILFVLLFYVKSTAMVIAERSVHLTTLFFLGKLEQAVNQFFVHILLLVTDSNPSWMIQRKGEEWPKNDRRNYFLINIHESMGPSRDRTRDPWICSQTHICCQTCYRLHYGARKGAQWLSGRVLDSRPKGRWFEPHRRHCVVVLEQDTFILA